MPIEYVIALCGKHRVQQRHPACREFCVGTRRKVRSVPVCHYGARFRVFPASPKWLPVTMFACNMLSRGFSFGLNG